MFNYNNISGNWRTTLLGAIVGIAQYLLISGVKFPSSKPEWGSFVVGLLTAAWGAIQKDGSTGSKAPV